MKVIYLRVSKEELDESTQLPEILKAFPKLNKYTILREKVSAYDEAKQDKRLEFIKLKRLIEDEQVSDVYVYSLERIERNMMRLFEFFFFCEGRGCKIHSALQPQLDTDVGDGVMGKFTRIQQIVIYGMLGEHESEMTSKRTKKAYSKGFSYKGNKWGAKFTNTDGKKVDLTKEEIDKLQAFIKKNGKYPYKYIQRIVAEKFELDIGTTYIHKVKYL